MHFLTLIFGIVVLPTVTTLKCYECMGTDSCTDTQKDCASVMNKCGAMRIFTYAGGSKVSDLQIKSCVMTEQCIEGSLNFGVAKTVISTKCCTGDLCNAQAAPEPPKTNPNGNKCYFCNGQSCTATLNCEGTEDRCISASMNMGSGNTVVKGCATQQMCTQNNAQMQSIGEVSCCQGNYCNSASGTSAGLLLLLAPLMSLVVFS